jgi:hypothetical protein
VERRKGGWVEEDGYTRLGLQALNGHYGLYGLYGLIILLSFFSRPITTYYYLAFFPFYNKIKLSFDLSIYFECFDLLPRVPLVWLLAAFAFAKSRKPNQSHNQKLFLPSTNLKAPSPPAFSCFWIQKLPTYHWLHTEEYLGPLSGFW